MKMFNNCIDNKYMTMTILALRACLHGDRVTLAGGLP